MAVTVIKSGVYWRWTELLPQSLTRQLLLTNGLWNSLVQSFREWEEEKAAIWSSYPEVAAIEVDIAALEQTITELVEVIRQAKIEQHTTKPKHPAVEVFKAERVKLADARERRRKAITAIGESCPEVKDRLEAALSERRKREKIMYREFTLQGGHWATYNDVHRRRFAGALKRVAEARKQGRPADLRTRRPSGVGTISVQLQKRDTAERTPDTISDAGASPWRDVLHVPRIPPAEWDAMSRAERRRAGRQTIRMRAGQTEDGDKLHLDIPVQIHRQLPDDAVISEARLTVVRVGPDLRAAVTVVATVRDPEPKTSGPMVVLHLGWSDHPDGIQIARWSSTAPLDIPQRWRHVVRADARRMSGAVIIGTNVENRLAAIDKARSMRDDELNRVKAHVADWIDTHGPIPSPFMTDGVRHEPLTGKTVRSWRSYGRFVSLERYLRAAAGKEWSGDPTLLGPLTEWAVRDRTRWRSQERGRQNILNHRDDVYKNVAYIFGTQALYLVHDDTSVADLARRQRGEDAPEHMVEGVARRRVIGAPGRLREYVLMATKREGGHDVKVPSKNLSLEHTCGHVNKPAPLDSAGTRECAGCNRRYNPDSSSLVLMQRRAMKALEKAAKGTKDKPGTPIYDITTEER